MESPEPAGPSTPAGDHSARYLEAPISLESLRTLLGLPSDRERLPPPSHLPRWWPTSLRPQYHPLPDPESNIGIYPNILHQERIAARHYRLFKFVQYGGLITQLLLSALIILLAAVPWNHRVAIAVFGALNGVITGALALIDGQGLPSRLVQYKDGLRELRERVEWLERELEAGMREVRYGEVVALREAYRTMREDESINRPEYWLSFKGPDKQ
ncbi:hypothetical protein BU26DRAFT_512523 [Trematosphaeria pertusa]|uniref:SMODS and SLOG-associating 2TM effector domain-containing protein n=1 Tax=Trematosphaeria pertusa TaxID=390896 RepID=A0A6A6IYC0_9PLEO|nr:uncharacterized protein BU26DRAFT_512523 [Trematosphaeria pertusa]KAF2255551.1 hypothetical protein BU26DRAFT_512523 [Trematosphaeria pertusa]